MHRVALISFAVIALLIASVIEYYAGHLNLESWFYSTHTWSSFVRELGFAAFIAFVIMVTVEEINKKRQMADFRAERKALKRDVFAAVFGVGLPENVRHAVTRNVLGQRFYRTDSTCDYEILPREFETANGGKKKGVLLKVYTSFTVKNVSHELADYDYAVFVEKPQLSGLKEPLREVNIDSLIIDGVALSKAEIDEADAKAPDDSAKRLARKITLRSGQQVKINSSFTAVRGFDDSELWITMLPNDGMKMSARFPVGVKSFGAVALNSTPLAVTQNSPATGYFAWELRNTALPYQGIMLWWRLTDEEDQARVLGRGTESKAPQ